MFISQIPTLGSLMTSSSTSTPTSSQLSAISPVFIPELGGRPATSSPTSTLGVQFDAPSIPSLRHDGDGTKALYCISIDEGIHLQPRPSTRREDCGRGVGASSSNSSYNTVTVSTSRAANHNKHKTEWCKNLRKLGGCPFGTKCHYIHYERERRSTGIVPLWPCFLALSTGRW